MLKCLYIGHDERLYPDYVFDGESLVAHPGDVREFENPPTDGRWVEFQVQDPVAKPTVTVKPVTVKE